MFRTISRSLVTLSLAGAAFAGELQAQETAQNTSFLFGTATISVRALSSGHVMVGVWRGGIRVTGTYDPSTIDAWAAQAAALFATDSTVAAAVELKTPFLFSTATSAIMVDRRTQPGAEEVFNIYLGDQESAHNLYLPVTRADANEFVAALRNAAQVSRELATAARGNAQGL